MKKSWYRKPLSITLSLSLIFTQFVGMAPAMAQDGETEPGVFMEYFDAYDRYTDYTTTSFESTSSLQGHGGIPDELAPVWSGVAENIEVYWPSGNAPDLEYEGEALMDDDLFAIRWTTNLTTDDFAGNYYFRVGTNDGGHFAIYEQDADEPLGEYLRWDGSNGSVNTGGGSFGSTDFYTGILAPIGGTTTDILKMELASNTTYTIVMEFCEAADTASAHLCWMYGEDETDDTVLDALSGKATSATDFQDYFIPAEFFSLPEAYVGNYIQGYVTNEFSGEPAANVTVSLGDDSVTTAYNGYYCLITEEAGDKTITFSGTDFVSQDVAVTVTSDTIMSEVLMIEDNVTYHQVTFQNEDDAVVSVRDGYRVDEPTTPLKDGSVFLGWMDSATGEYYDFSTAVTSNVTLVAQWRALVYGDITITVVDESGAPVEGATVKTSGCKADTDANGVVVFADLLEGSYYLSTTKIGMTIAIQTVVVDADSTEITAELVISETDGQHGFGHRVAVTTDGNAHDQDDWAATPATLAILAAIGAQDDLVHYGYNSHVWDDDWMQDKIWGNEAMQESIDNAREMFGFTNDEVFWDDRAEAADHYSGSTAEGSINHFVEEIEKSTADDPLYVMLGGPSESLYRAISQATQGTEYVIVISHSAWNETHVGSSSEVHDATNSHSLADVVALDTGMQVIYIENQNGSTGMENSLLATRYDNGSYNYDAWDFLENANNDGLNFIYQRMVYQSKADISDSGMLYYTITGDEYATYETIETFFETYNFLDWDVSELGLEETDLEATTAATVSVDVADMDFDAGTTTFSLTLDSATNLKALYFTLDSSADAVISVSDDFAILELTDDQYMLAYGQGTTNHLTASDALAATIVVAGADGAQLSISDVIASTATDEQTATIATATASSVDAFALDAALTAKLAEIATAQAAYVEADYQSAQWTDLVAIFTDGIAQITAMTDATLVASYDISALTAAADLIPTTLDLYDLNEDGVISYSDITSIVSYYGYKNDSALFDAKYDVNGNGSIGSEDYLVVFHNIGK